MRRASLPPALRLLAPALLLLAAGCDVEPYCVGSACAVDARDGGRDDRGGADDAGRDVAAEDGLRAETDADSVADDGGGADEASCPDGTDFLADPANCGCCGCRCNLPNAWNRCVGGVCQVDRCDVNYWDIDARPENGCEYYCIPEVAVPGGCTPPACVPTVPGGECDTTCDVLDDDCNGAVDDCVDKTTDPDNCGACGRRCRFPNATARCVDGDCRLEACLPGYWDLDGSAGNGCEYECGPADGSPPPAETCNGVDDDCDGETDDGDPGGGGPCGTDVGACERGTMHCLGGLIECVGGSGPGAEECNGADDDCDGETDEEYPERDVACGTATGECEQGTSVCLRGTIVCDGAVTPVPEICNGRDDDCDGSIDNGAALTISCFPPPPGVCDGGTPACLGGLEVCDGETRGTTEVCNGVDDDCDGPVDEGLGRPCGSDIGECAAGTETCAGGRWGACTGGVGPAAETCNDRDDDCDGIIDGLTRTCGSDVGECSFGRETCTAGAWGACTGGRSATTETCNVLDDDCDGATDEGNPGGGAACGSGTGECRRGTMQCVAGAVVCVGAVEPVAETCNGRDDDCDGTADEGNPGGGAACGTATGECRQGTTRCVGGVLDCDGDVGPASETCNGRDDDCDGSIDDSPALTIVCSPPPAGICVAGTPSCVGGVQVCAGEVPGTPETCNGGDDDCDGAIDEDFNLASDPNNCGVCGRRCALPHVATNVCLAGTCRVGACAAGFWDVDGSPANGCEYACTYNGVETCNGRDDDCDMLTDAADPDMAATRPTPAAFCNTTGACSTATVACGLWLGAIRWYCVYAPPVVVDGTGTIQPETRCNAVDEDCDGTTDENWPAVRHSAADPADSCAAGIGACLRTGNYVCTADGLGQTCSVTAGAPSTETCNGIDDNCDAATDNLAETDFTNWGAVQITGLVDTNRDGARDTTRTFYVMRWEASRPDATAASAGTISNQRVCSRTGVLPWTDVNWTQARDACCRLNAGGTCRTGGGGLPAGWNLCVAYDWRLACELSAGPLYYAYPYGNAYAATTCNGNDYDTNAGLAGDQDDILRTAFMTGCRNATSFPPSSSWVYDASGNVKEWTWSSRVVGGATYYEIRGGASNNAASGLTCAFDFTLGSASFSFPNVGFRCCYY